MNMFLRLKVSGTTPEDFLLKSHVETQNVVFFESHEDLTTTRIRATLSKAMTRCGEHNDLCCLREKDPLDRVVLRNIHADNKPRALQKRASTALLSSVGEPPGLPDGGAGLNAKVSVWHYAAARKWHGIPSRAQTRQSGWRQSRTHI